MDKIGITMGLQRFDRYGVHPGYADAISELNCLPVFLPSAAALAAEANGGPDRLNELVVEMVSDVSALIVTGGWDVDPATYGEDHSELLGDIEPIRDRFEMGLIHEARQQGKRILAICRGVQILNVALGGSLIQDLQSEGFLNHTDLVNEYGHSHHIEWEGDSTLQQLMEGETSVNAIHHQAVRRVADPLRVVARSTDGVIEALEGDKIIGIQWHPERLFKMESAHLAPFAWLVGSA